MKNIKRWIRNRHKLNPWLEPSVLFVLTTFFGFSSSRFHIALESQPWHNMFLWITLSLSILILLYYVYFSTYSVQYYKNKSYTKEDHKQAYLEIKEQKMRDGDLEGAKKVDKIYRDTQRLIK